MLILVFALELQSIEQLKKKKRPIGLTITIPTNTSVLIFPRCDDYTVKPQSNYKENMSQKVQKGSRLGQRVKKMV